MPEERNIMTDPAGFYDSQETTTNTVKLYNEQGMKTPESLSTYDEIELRKVALSQANGASQPSDSFDDLMSRAETIYAWLKGGTINPN